MLTMLRSLGNFKYYGMNTVLFYMATTDRTLAIYGNYVDNQYTHAVS